MKRLAVLIFLAFICGCERSMSPPPGPNEQFFATWPKSGTFAEQNQWMEDRRLGPFKLNAKCLLPDMLMVYGNPYDVMVTLPDKRLDLKYGASYDITGNIMGISVDNSRTHFEIHSGPIIATETK
jgi:hypothetical protein